MFGTELFAFPAVLLAVVAEGVLVAVVFARLARPAPDVARVLGVVCVAHLLAELLAPLVAVGMIGAAATFGAVFLGGQNGEAMIVAMLVVGFVTSSVPPLARAALALAVAWALATLAGRLPPTED